MRLTLYLSSIVLPGVELQTGRIGKSSVNLGVRSLLLCGCTSYVFQCYTYLGSGGLWALSKTASSIVSLSTSGDGNADPVQWQPAKACISIFKNVYQMLGRYRIYKELHSQGCYCLIFIPQAHAHP